MQFSMQEDILCLVEIRKLVVGLWMVSHSLPWNVVQRQQLIHYEFNWNAFKVPQLSMVAVIKTNCKIITLLLYSVLLTNWILFEYNELIFVELI